MNKGIKKPIIGAILLAALSLTAFSLPNPVVSTQIFKSAEANTNWKLAFLTGNHAQVVFMNVSPETNPKNEIGMETHPFDQVILLVQGHGEALLNGKKSVVKAGDLIFIPQGVEHNVINSSPKIPLKLISFYSNRDIPANAIYKNKAEESKE